MEKATTKEMDKIVRYDDVLQQKVSDAKKDKEKDKTNAKELLKFLAVKEQVDALQSICAQLSKAARRSDQ